MNPQGFKKNGFSYILIIPTLSHGKGRGWVVPIQTKETPDNKSLAISTTNGTKKGKMMEVLYQPPRRMYERHPRHHLACLKFHRFLCPYSFNIHNISEILPDNN